MRTYGVILTPLPLIIQRLSMSPVPHHTQAVTQS